MSDFRQRLRYDEALDLVIVESMQDVEPLLRMNQARKNESDGYSPSRELRLVADIPFVLAHEWYNQGLNIFDDEDWQKIESMLMDPDFARLRTAEGEIRDRPTRHYYRGSTSSRKALAGFNAEVVE